MSIDKTVKLESIKLSDDEFSTIDRMYYKGLLCKNDFYQRFAGVKSLSLIQNSKDFIEITLYTPYKKVKDILDSKITK